MSKNATALAPAVAIAAAAVAKNCHSYVKDVTVRENFALARTFYRFGLSLWLVLLCWHQLRELLNLRLPSIRTNKSSTHMYIYIYISMQNLRRSLVQFACMTANWGPASSQQSCPANCSIWNKCILRYRYRCSCSCSHCYRYSCRQNCIVLVRSSNTEPWTGHWAWHSRSRSRRCRRRRLQRRHQRQFVRCRIHIYVFLCTLSGYCWWLAVCVLVCVCDVQNPPCQPSHSP